MPTTELDIKLAAIQALAEAFRAMARHADALAKLVEAPAAPPPPELSEDEQAIVDALTDQPYPVTGQTLATLTGNEPDSGTFRNRLASMVRRGILRNMRPGYRLP